MIELNTEKINNKCNNCNRNISKIKFINCIKLYPKIENNVKGYKSINKLTNIKYCNIKYYSEIFELMKEEELDIKNLGEISDYWKKNNIDINEVNKTRMKYKLSRCNELINIYGSKLKHINISLNIISRLNDEKWKIFLECLNTYFKIEN